MATTFSHNSRSSQTDKQTNITGLSTLGLHLSTDDRVVDGSNLTRGTSRLTNPVHDQLLD